MSNDFTALSAGSPRAMMDRRIDTAVSAGVLTPQDRAAVAVALDTVDHGLSRDGAGAGGSMKARIDALISAQVNNGTLTTDQGVALESFFGGETTPEISPSQAALPPVASEDKAPPGVKTAREQIASFEAMLDRMRRSLTPADIYGAGSTAGSGLVFNRDA
ncbi:hypothetical protein ACFSC3_00325 [Sphingomonas floccifaciens]|uniref:Uncharacterized protein n=1 Tax=Sphingomonas floccifaciens TaxID=1844115 RepID=A0ABW4N7T8_9SPHN